jgi:hypothetical protein
LVRKASILGVNSWEDALGVLKPVRRIVIAARFLAAIISNLTRASRTLVLRALFGASKSCALVNLFMDLPPMAGEQPADNDQILSLITAI